MCGIAGYLGPDSIDPARVQACLGLMGRRGPDHAASYEHVTRQGLNVRLLHSRLSILDLEERSNQPFRDGSRVMVYNGELYNFLEVKDELAAAGHGFATTGDTEVFLRALGQWGEDALDRCEGMWALAVFDEASDTLLLSRDRFGEKPLYYCRDRGGLYFGSEVKFITALMGRRLEINYDQVYRYLVNGYKALYKDGQTFFRDLAELPAGAVMTLGPDGEARTRRYWRPDYQRDEDMTYQEAVAGARQRLIDSVRLRLRADVPLAFCLSGGVDSNALVGIAKRLLGYDVHGFTIMNTDERYDERELVERSAAELGIRHTPVPLETGDFLPKLRTLVGQHDAPVYTITYYTHWKLMERIAAHGYRISISGTGADELFSGYYDHHNFYLGEVHARPDIFASALADWTRYIKPIVRNPYLQNPYCFIDDPGLRDHIYLNAEGFAEFLIRPWLEGFAERDYCPETLRNRMLNELFHEAVPPILHEDDLNAMYYSIENRSPYLDRDLFEFASRIPTRHLIRGGFAKAVLRDASRGLAPDLILDNHRKVGFNAPIFALLDVDDPEVRAYLLDDGPVFEHVRRDMIAELITRERLPNSDSKFLFYFLNVKMFMEEFGA